jgi:hypothetical protein
MDCLKLFLQETFSMNSSFMLENENNSTDIITTNTTQNEFNSFYFYEVRFNYLISIIDRVRPNMILDYCRCLSSHPEILRVILPFLFKFP